MVLIGPSNMLCRVREVYWTRCRDSFEMAEFTIVEALR